MKRSEKRTGDLFEGFPVLSYFFLKNRHLSMGFPPKIVLPNLTEVKTPTHSDSIPAKYQQVLILYQKTRDFFECLYIDSTDDCR